MASRGNYRRRRGEGVRGHTPTGLVEADPVMERHIFVWDGGGRDVYLMGSFNNWRKILLKIPYGANGVSVDIQLPVGTHQYMFEVDGVKKTDPANTMALTPSGYNQVVIRSITDGEAEMPPPLDDDDHQDSFISNTKASTSLFLKYPYQANRFILDHLKSFGYSECITHHQWKSPNTAIVSVTPASIGAEIISKLNGSKVHGKYRLVVESYKPMYEKKRPQMIQKTSITASGHCKLFVGSDLPRYTNEQHIRDHFENFSRCITNVEVVRDRYTKRCKGYGYVTFTTIEHAREAILALHRSKLLGVIVNVNFRTSRSQLPPGDSKGYEYEPTASRTPVGYEYEPTTASRTPLGYEYEPTTASSTPVVTVVVHTYPKLPFSMLNADFRNHFRDFHSDIANAFLIKDEQHQEPYKRGTGIVEFSSVKAAEYAVEKMMNTRIIGKYEIKYLYIDDDENSSSSTELNDNSEHSRSTYEDKKHPSDNHRAPGVKPLETDHDSPRNKTSNGISDAASQESPASQCCVVIENLDPMFTESQIRSMIEVPMVSCRRLPLHSNNILIKCHTAADALSIVKKLHLKKYLGKVVSVRLTSDNEVHTNSFNTSSGHPGPSAASSVDAIADLYHTTEANRYSENVSTVIELDPHQWNALMLANPETKILQYNEIKEPFKNNPDITFRADHEHQSLRLTGKQGAVQDAWSFLVKRLKQEIQVDERYKMEALCHLRPDLPSYISQKCGVLVKEFRPDSKTIKLEGKTSNLEIAHNFITKSIEDLTYERIKLDYDCGPEDIKRHNKELSDSPNTGVYVSQDPHSTSTLTVWSFDAAAIQKAKPVLTINTFYFDCGTEEALYLKRFKQNFICELPAKLDFVEDGIVLKGTKEAVEQTSVRIHEKVLQGLYSRKFSFSCKLKFKDHIEQTVLMPQSAEDSSFQYLTSLVGKHSQSNVEANVDFEVFIYSKVPEMFSKISSTLDYISPSSKEYSISKHSVETIVMEKKPYLENRYNVILVLSSRTSTLVIDGLIPAEVQACYDELQDFVENNLDTMKQINITTQQYTLLRLYQTNIAEVKRICNIAFTTMKTDSKSGMITLTGTIRQVNVAHEKLSDLLNMEVYSEAFTLHCPSSLYKMWVKRWTQMKQQEERNTKTCINFTTQTNSRDSDELSVTFEIIGSDVVCVQEAKQAIVSEGTQTEEKVVTLSPAGVDCLQKAKNDLLKDSIVVIQKIEKKSNKVTLIAPKELSESLDTAEVLIRKFVGERANANFFMCSKDPVVNLVLSHPQRGMEVAMRANGAAQQYQVNVVIQKKPAGLRLTGTESAIENAKSLVEFIIYNVETTIGNSKVFIDPLCTPFLASSEFLRFENKLGNDLCVTCSYPKSGLTSILVCSTQVATATPGLTVKVEISKGDLVYEQVDAIVNAANENLKHIGGLAKAILDAGGQRIQEECDEYIATCKKLKTGNAVCLGSGDLPCKRIVHAVGPRWGGGQQNEEQYLYYSVLESLKAASSEFLTSIAFPAIGTGVFGVPPHVSARMSLKAVKDFFQSQSQSTITHVKFVLLEATTSDFVSVLQTGICGTLQQNSHPTQVGSSSLHNLKHSAPTSLPPAFSHDPTSSNPAWQWRNDQGTFMPYSPTISRELESAYKTNPSLTALVEINGNSYTIDFQAMEQVNDDTGATRKLRNYATSSHAANSSDIQWEYRERHQYMPYTPQQSASIEKMYQDGVVGQLIISNTVYIIDPLQMHQTNSLTNYKRKIKRHVVSQNHATFQDDVEEEEEEAATAPRDVVITLRGPHDNLHKAETLLQEKLKGSLSIFCFDKLPQGSTTDLEKKLGQIAKKHTLKCSFVDSQSSSGKTQRVMNLKGVSFKCKAALEAIQEEVLNFHLSSEGAVITYPPEWVTQTNTTEVFQVKRRSSEWSHIHGLFTHTMGGQQVVQIERIQNKWLWEKYHAHKKRLDQKNNGQVNEKDLFHGTRGNDPRNIYEGEQGFDMRFSAQGMWGTANYFAVKANYSEKYSYQSPQGKQMFLVKVLTGESYDCPQGDHSLRIPPVKTSRPLRGGVQFAQMRYDTVTGQTHGTQVFMTYDNDKAYPAYLITYK